MVRATCSRRRARPDRGGDSDRPRRDAAGHRGPDRVPVLGSRPPHHGRDPQRQRRQRPVRLTRGMTRGARDVRRVRRQAQRTARAATGGSNSSRTRRRRESGRESRMHPPSPPVPPATGNPTRTRITRDSSAALDNRCPDEIGTAGTGVHLKPIDHPLRMGVEQLVDEADDLDSRDGAHERDGWHISARGEGNDVVLEAIGRAGARQDFGVDWHGRNISGRWRGLGTSCPSKKTKLTGESTRARRGSVRQW